MKMQRMQGPEIQITEKSVTDILRTISSCPSQGDDPFFVADLGDVIAKYSVWVKNLPRVQPFYAVKCCPEPVVVELLETLGVNFDCASKGEIELVSKLGIDNNERIIYANPCKVMSHIKYAVKKNVTMMTFDNVCELYKVKKYHPNARMVLRLKVENKDCISELGLKFGASLTEVPELLQTAQELDINVIGVSFHVGSGCTDLQAFNRAISDAEWTFRQAENYGYKFHLLDIGGGFPGDSTSPVVFEDVAHVIRRSLDKHFPLQEGVKIIAEPGRFFVSSAFTLCTNIIAKRKSKSESNCKIDAVTNQYYINDGVYGSLNAVMFENRKLKPIPMIKPNTETVYNSIVWGPTCDSVDLVAKDCLLPELDIGDWLVFFDVGAYSYCAASNFNGFGPTFIHYYISSDYRMKIMKVKALIEMNGRIDSQTTVINTHRDAVTV